MSNAWDSPRSEIHEECQRRCKAASSHIQNPPLIITNDWVTRAYQLIYKVKTYAKHPKSYEFAYSMQNTLYFTVLEKIACNQCNDSISCAKAAFGR